ncbi:MAG: M56 family metallopeptidase [Saprospiraceae bacterium]
MFLTYSIKVALFWAGSYLIYRLFLENETTLKANRFFLLATLALGLILPLVSFTGTTEAVGMAEIILPAITIQWDTLSEAAAVSSKENSINWVFGLKAIYFVGLGLALLRFAFGIYKITSLKLKNEQFPKGEYLLIKTDFPHAPFSFLNWMFWSKSFEVDREEEQQIISHELAHIRQGHTYDNLFSEVLSIVFWWNPIIYFYKKAIKDNHEFLADASVIQWKSKKQYGQLLIRQSQVAPAFFKAAQPMAMANHFFHSKLKKRITMMTKNASGKWSRLKYLLAIPILGLVFFACQETAKDQQDLEKKVISVENIDNTSGSADLNTEYLIDTVITFDPETMEESMQIIKNEVYKVVDEMPRFPGCEDESGDKDKCAQQRMLEYIYKNIQYPEEAKKADVEGTVVVSFIVSSWGGKIIQPEIKRSIGGGTDEEVLRVVNLMPPWIPGRQNGKEVNVRFHLPIRFKLD